MKNETLLEKAHSLIHSRSQLVAALAVLPLAAAPAAQAIAASITVNPGTVTFENPDSGTDDPLHAYAGNNTDSVSLAGSASADSFSLSGPTSRITFENTGTITAATGEYLLINYDFEQDSNSSGGHTADYSFSLDLFIDEDGQMISASDSGLTPASDSVPVEWMGAFQTTAFTQDLIGQDLRLVLTVTYDNISDSPILFSNSVVVPQNSITLSAIESNAVPEPSSLLLFAAALAPTGLMVRRRKSKEQKAQSVSS